jgi:hypothetical protein
LTLLLTVQAASAAPEFPGKDWTTARPESVGMDATILDRARAYALSAGGSGFITRHGRLVMHWGDAKSGDLLLK